MRRRAAVTRMYTLTIKTEPYASVSVNGITKESDYVGYVTFQLKKGYYTGRVYKSGYYTGYFSVDLTGDTIKNVTLTVIPPDTLLLLHAEDFTDSSKFGRTVANPLDTVSLADDGKFGKSFMFCSNDRDRLVVDDLLLDPSCFTVECFVNSYNTFGIRSIITNGRGSFEMRVQNGRFMLVNEYVAEIGNDTRQFPENTFVHTASTMQDGIIRGFVGGVKCVEAECNLIHGQGLVIGNNKTAIYHGYEPCPFYGLIDEVRISSTCRWTEDFTPPAFPYTAD